MAKPKHQPECLCDSHSKALDVKPKYAAKSTAELGPDEDVECEMCFVAIMRRNGIA